MMFKSIALLSTLLVPSTLAADSHLRSNDDRDLMGNRSNNNRMMKVTVRNLVYANPMGPFFVAVHNEYFPPLFTPGMPAPDNGLQTLAEEGSPADLEAYYADNENALFVGSFIDDAALNLPEPAAFLLELGESNSFMLPMDKDYPYVSFASMMVNTNDAFVGIRSMELEPGMSFMVPAWDSGTEENNEDCLSVPGPACGPARMGADAVQSGNGEGYVHIHRGIHGEYQGETTDLAPSRYDWRNPSLMITVEEM